LLKESIARLKGEKPKRLPHVMLKLDFLNDEVGESLLRIPASYLSDTRLRIQAYRRIASSIELSNIEDLRRELRDRYGPLPSEVELLLQCAAVRILAAYANVDTVETRDDKIMLSQRGVLFQVGGKFPRMASDKPEGKLTEIKKLLDSMSDERNRSRAQSEHQPAR